MDEMIRYIFGSLRSSENALGVVAKTLRRQRSFNKNVTVFTLAATAVILIHEHEIRCLNDQIKTMKKEMKELQPTEGD